MIPIRDTIPSHHRPVVTWALIAANALVFLVAAGMPEAAYYTFGFVPLRFTDPAWAASRGLPGPGALPLFTSMFLHGGWLHLVFNMWTLWIFGDNVEDRMGRWRFLAFYLLCGLAAALAHWALNATSDVPVVGASGAIAGVLGAYLVLYPQSRILTLIPIFFWPLFVELSALIFLGGWLLIQLVSGAMELGVAGSAAGVAWWAHVGGFFAGMLLYRFFLRRRPHPTPVRHLIMVEPPPYRGPRWPEWR